MADTHGTFNIVDGAFVPLATYPNAAALFEAQQVFMYAIWGSKIKTYMGMSIVQNHEVYHSAQAIWHELTAHQTTSTAGSIT